MNKQEIETYLAKLGQELQDMGVQQPVRILLVGGAFMLTQVPNSRPNTNDIDVLLKDVDDPASQPYRMFKAAVRAVASQIGSQVLGSMISLVILFAMSALCHKVPCGTSIQCSKYMSHLMNIFWS